MSTEEPKVAQTVEDGSDDDAGSDPEVGEVVGNWKLVDLPEIPVVTGEEEE